MRQLQQRAEALASTRSLTQQKKDDGYVLHWLQVAWEGEGDKRRAVQWVGYYAGHRVAVITWVRQFGKRPAGYMVTVMRRSAGVYKQLYPAQIAAGNALFDVAEGIVDLFTAWMKHYDELRTYSEMLYAEVGQGVWALGQWAAAAYEQRLKESQAAIEASKAQIEAFNARFAVKRPARGGGLR